MGVSLDSNYLSMMSALQQSTATTTSKTAALESTIANTDFSSASDEELMKVAKDFEAYFIEQVMKQAKSALVPRDEEEEGDYMKMFGDQLYTEYAKKISESGDTGLAQQLYESMRLTCRGIDK